MGREKRPGELQREIDAPAPRPDGGAAPARDGVAAGHFHIRRENPRRGALAAQDGVREVHHKVAVIGLRKRVLVDSGPLGGGQFGFDFVVLQKHRVVARFGVFLVVRKTRAVPFLRAFERSGNDADGTRPGHHQQVEHIPDPRAAQVRVAESHDGAVGDVVTGAAVPPDVVRIRGQLRHPERDGSPGECMAVPAGSEKHVYESGGIFWGSGAEPEGSGGQRRFEHTSSGNHGAISLSCHARATLRGNSLVACASACGGEIMA